VKEHYHPTFGSAVAEPCFSRLNVHQIYNYDFHTAFYNLPVGDSAIALAQLDGLLLAAAFLFAPYSYSFFRSGKSPTLQVIPNVLKNFGSAGAR